MLALRHMEIFNKKWWNVSVKMSPKNLYHGKHDVDLFNGKSLFEMCH